MKYILVAFLGFTTNDTSASMLKFENEAECEAARSAIVNEFMAENDNLSTGDRLDRGLRRRLTKCVPYTLSN